MMGRERNLYPHLRASEARKLIARDARLDAERERQVALFRDRAKPYLARALRTAEQQRVAALIEQDKAARESEIARSMAEQQVLSGNFENMADTVIEPTREQLANGHFEPFIPRQPDGTVRVIRTVRRMRVPVVKRMESRGQIGLRELAACVWYADTFERTGFNGSIPSVELEYEIHSPQYSRLAFTDRQLEAMADWRFVRSKITIRNLKIFDAIVLFDQPLNRAAQSARKRKSAVLAAFRNTAECVAEAISAIKGVA